MVPELSVIMPVYNEVKTVSKSIAKVLRVPVDKELIVVDDGSGDGTYEILKNMNHKRLKVLMHEKNMGKGCAIRTGLQCVRGRFVIIQDADLEYDPMDYVELLGAVDDGTVVVYGSRNLKQGNKHSYVSFWLGGVLLTQLANLLYGLNITDVATCYKLFDSEILKSIDLKYDRFEFEFEVTIQIAKKGLGIKEVPINYYPRKMADGKKIRWQDGICGAWVLLKSRFFN